MNEINRYFLQNTEIRFHVGLHLLCDRFPVTKPYICKLSSSCCREVLVWNPLPYIMRLKSRELLLLVHIYLFITFVSVQWMVHNLDCRFEWDCLLPTINSDLNLTRAVPKFKCLSIKDCEGADSRPLRNIGNYLPVDAASLTRIYQCSSLFHFFFSVDKISLLLSSPLLRLLLILVYVYCTTDESERHMK